MRIFLIMIFFTLLLPASVLDFSYLNKAKEAYESGKYEEAFKLYQKVESDEAKFNAADSLYQQKKYKEALAMYENIKDKKLSFKKLHNIGNSYAQLGKIDEAIKSYEKALAVHKDEDTKHNLELLKKKKDKQKKDKEKNDKEKNDKEKNDKEKNDKEKNKNSKKQDQDKSNKDAKQKKEQQKKEQEKAKDKGDKDKKQQAMGDLNQTKQPPISNMEERKWQKMLNKRGVNTLMIPLNSKGEKNHEKNPW